MGGGGGQRPGITPGTLIRSSRTRKPVETPDSRARRACAGPRNRGKGPKTGSAEVIPRIARNSGGRRSGRLRRPDGRMSR